MLKKILIGGIVVLFVANVSAMDIIPSNSGYYYSLGGGSDISMPPVTDQQDITIGGDVNTNLGYTCNGFNPAVSISNTINNIAGSVEGVSQDIINSATAAVGSMPMYLIEKASPELYNLLQNTMTNASDTFHLSVNSCQDDLNKISQGKSPYQDWFNISDSQGWLKHVKAARQGEDVDVNAAKAAITKNPQKYGVPWVHKGKNSGGTDGNQVPINVISDVAVAGYNVMIDPHRALDDPSPAPTDSELAKYWKTPSDISTWTKLVLGDITISAKTTEDTKAGVGLVTLLRSCPVDANNKLTCAVNKSGSLLQNLENLVSGSTPINSDSLKAVSTNEMMITPQVINAIRNMPLADQAVAISKLAEDIAIQNLVDEALMLRRVLIAGSQTKPVQNLKPALTVIQSTLKVLDQDIKNLLFEHQIRSELTSKTLNEILSTQSDKKQQAMSEHDVTQQPEVNNGAIYKSDND